ncbi:MAG: aminoacyl-tRNA hydrolase [Cyanobacteria bacterium]|nr:aminoacyl-tRNA hydrolase [Cyanobacteriota bacterium]
MLVINERLQIPADELELTYSRSGGPGGQNVNKVNSKARLRFPVIASQTLPESVRERFLSKYGNRITTEGDLIITSQTYRDQARNADECLEKLRGMIISVLSPPRQRRATKPTKASVIRRTTTKRQTSTKKQNRRRPNLDD